MAHLSLNLLGRFTITLDGEPASGFDSNKVRALLAYLAVESDRSHRRESLAALLWPESPARSARTNLRNALANLRKVLRHDDPDQPIILVTRDTLQFNQESNAYIDVTAFNALVNIENPSFQQLEKAVGIYQGSFLHGFSLKDSLAFDDWTLIMRERLHRKALKALQHLSSHFAHQGDYTQACDFARKQVELEPWREEAHRDLMRLLAIAGQRSQALVQYDTCRQVLDAELGVTPSQETKDLYVSIRDGQLEDLGIPVDAHPSVTPSPMHNLPVQLTPFVGRESEMAVISAYLEDPACRLLTLVGPGGSGKSRLAIEVGFQWVDRFEHGVFWVSLAPLQSTDALISALASALNYTFYEGVAPRQQILNFLHQKNMLLIFDNFEHLLSTSVDQFDDDVEDAAAFVISILKNALDVQILVTSRIMMNLQGEVIYSVSGLAVPEQGTRATVEYITTAVPDTTEFSALALFEIGAQRVSPDFSLTGDNLSHVVRICHLVNGMPLGILLAAGWSRVLSAREIVEQIDESFDFLEAEIRDLPERQRSMRSVFNHSWKLLSTRERDIMLALSVFQGQSSRTAVQAVTGAKLRDLRSLADKSLLQINSNGYHEVHVLLRHFILEKLNQFPDLIDKVRSRHSAYYLNAVQQWWDEIRGPYQETALFEMHCELENIRHSWTWALDKGNIIALGQVSQGLLFLFMNYRILRDGEIWFQSTVERLEEISSPLDIEEPTLTQLDIIRAYALILAHCVYINNWGPSDRQLQQAEKSRMLIEKLGSTHQDIRQLKADFIFFTVWTLEKNIRLDNLQLALHLYQDLGNQWGTLWTLHALAWSYWTKGQYNKSLHVLQQGLPLSRILGAPREIIITLSIMGSAAWEVGDYNLAGQIWEENYTRRKKLVKNQGMEQVMLGMAHICLLRGNLSDSMGYAKSCIALGKELEYQLYIEVGKRRQGLAFLAAGRYEEAKRTLCDSLNIASKLYRYEFTSSSVRLAEAMLHLGEYEQALIQALECMNHAREVDTQRNISFCHLVQGRLALVNDEYQESITLLQQGIDILEGMGPRRELGPAYADLCIASIRMGKPKEANQYLKTALEMAVNTGDFVAHVYVLPITAFYFAEYGHTEKSVTLYITAMSYPMVANSHWFADILCNHFPEVKTLASTVFTREDQGAAISALHTTVQDLLADFV